MSKQEGSEMNRGCIVIMAGLAAAGCVPQNRDDGFRASRPLGAVPADSGRAEPADTAQTATAPLQSPFGFRVEVVGPAELHFTDEEGRHTGPATAEEYLPVLEAALRNPSLHEQERAGLERMRDQIKRTGSASGMAITRRIPNLEYQAKGGSAEATYPGSDALDMRLAPTDHAVFRLTLTTWDRQTLRTASYSVPSGPGREVGLDVSAVMEDLTLSWDSVGDGEPDREIAPEKVETVRRR